jgi:hypothetical protein
MNKIETELLESIQNREITFLIGNGINRYPKNPPERSWEKILVEVYNELTNNKLNYIPKGINLTEFHDVLDLETNHKSIAIQKAFIQRLNWNPDEHHERIVEKIQTLKIPILTTNFDLVLEKTNKCNLYRHKIEKLRALSDYYPWDSYYSDSLKLNPFDDFSIWHINGQIDYKRSIKLGLNHYLLMVNQVKKHFPHISSTEINYDYERTWLKILFEKDICIFGLGLDEQEVFIRWLLLERAKYFKKNPSKSKQGWYVNFDKTNEFNVGKKFFLKSVGFKYVDYTSERKYDDFYQDFWNKI